MSVVWSFKAKQWRKHKPGNKDLGNGFSLKGNNGVTVVLIHGLTGTPNEMRFLANYLNKKGYSVICPRLANHGESILVLKDTRWQEFYESVRKLFTEGELANHAGPIFTGGLSMGALLALLAADEFSAKGGSTSGGKDRIAGVCCLAPTLFYDGWNTPYSRHILLLLNNFTPLKYLAYFKEEPPYGIKSEAIQQRIHKYYATASLDDIENVAQYGYPYFPAPQLYQLHLLVKYITKKLPGMRFPVQLIQAKDDDMTSVKNSKYIYDKIGSKMKEIVLLYNSYHVITADQERDTVAAKMENFFERVLTRDVVQDKEFIGELDNV